MKGEKGEGIFFRNMHVCWIRAHIFCQKHPCEMHASLLMTPYLYAITRTKRIEIIFETYRTLTKGDMVTPKNLPGPALGDLTVVFDLDGA